jgi:hypothetical protein
VNDDERWLEEKHPFIGLILWLHGAFATSVMFLATLGFGIAYLVLGNMVGKAVGGFLTGECLLYLALKLRHFANP